MLNPARPAAANACSEADIQFIQQQFNVAGQTYAQLETNLKARNVNCASCIFSKETDPQWGPIVYAGGAGGAFINYGACFAQAPGGGPACGNAVQQSDLCLQVVCDETACGSAQAATACSNTAYANPASCGKYNIQGNCPNVQQAAMKCDNGINMFRYLCSSQL